MTRLNHVNGPDIRRLGDAHTGPVAREPQGDAQVLLHLTVRPPQHDRTGRVGDQIIVRALEIEQFGREGDNLHAGASGLQRVVNAERQVVAHVVGDDGFDGRLERGVELEKGGHGPPF